MISEEDWRLLRQALARFESAAHGRTAPVLRQPPLADLADELGVEAWIQRGGLTGADLACFVETYLRSSTRLHHPRYMGHQVAVPEPLAAVGALIEAFTNNVSNVFEMGPAAATIEFVLLNWMLRMVGWRVMPMPGIDPGPRVFGGGTFTDGGSLANLTALLAARARVAPQAWRAGIPQRLIVIAPAESHYSIGRAVDILGLGRQSLVSPPTTSDGRILPGALAEFIHSQQRTGNSVLAVVATAGTTSAGLFDDLVSIGDVCQRVGVWLHVDGAHGASALLSARQRHRLDGIAQADSLIWDAHKMLRTPALCTAVLVKDHRDLDAAFHQDASYLFHDKDQPGVDFLHRTLECTRSGLGLRLFLALATHGESGIAAYIDRQVALARDAAAYLASVPGISVAVEPEFNIVCFRVDGDDALQLAVRRRLLGRGTFYVTTTRFFGQQWLRLTLMNPRTDLDDIRRLGAEVLAARAAVLTKAGSVDAPASGPPEDATLCL